MSVEINIDCTYDDTNTQEIKATVTEVDTGKTESWVAPDGDNTAELTNLDGDVEYEYEVDLEIQSDDATTTPEINGGVAINVPGTYSPPEQNKITAEADWFKEALDLGQGVRRDRPHKVILTTSDGQEAEFRPTSINYSPAINAAKDASVTCEPFEFLEDDTFMGATMKIESMGTLIYQGTVDEISYQQPKEEYNIDTRSEGKKLLDKAISFTADTMLVSNAFAKAIDNFNTIDGEYETATGTSDETLTNLTKNMEDSLVVSSGNTTGTAEYYEVGRSALNLSVIYVRAYAPGDGIDIKIDDGDTVHTETINITGNKLGEWKAIKPTGLDDSYYDITFDLQDSEAILHDWRAIQSAKIWREVTRCDCPLTGYNDTLYTYNSDSDDGIPEGNPNMRVTETADGYQARQKALWDVVDSSHDGATSVSGNATYDQAISTSGENYHYLAPFDGSGVSLPAWELWARIALHNDNGTGTADYRIEFISTNEQVDGTIDTETLDTNTYEWVKLADHTDNDNVHYDLQYTGNGTDRPAIRGMDSGDDDVYFSDFVVIIGDDADVSYEYEFDDELTNGHLDSPQTYDQGYVEFDPVTVDTNIMASEASSTINGQTDVQGGWGIVQTTDTDDWGFDELPNSDTTQDMIVASESEHAIRTYLNGYGLRDDDTPRKGYQSQEVTEVTAKAIYSSLYVLYNKDISYNILSAINDIVTDTRYLFRFEGDTIVAFERESRTVSDDIIEESIESTRSTQGVYKSAEVIGKDGVSSGIVESADAPPSVSRHKEIRDETVTTRSQAISQAKEFLGENDDIEYSGSIETLPTFVPLGEQIPGSEFTHGQPMTLESVSYSMGGATAQLGETKDIATELITINSRIEDTKRDTTSS